MQMPKPESYKVFVLKIIRMGLSGDKRGVERYATMIADRVRDTDPKFAGAIEKTIRGEGLTIIPMGGKLT